MIDYFVLAQILSTIAVLIILIILTISDVKKTKELKELVECNNEISKNLEFIFNKLIDK